MLLQGAGHIAVIAIERTRTESAAGKRTAAYRPFPAVALFLAEVYPHLKDVLPPDVWEYPNSDSAVSGE